MREIETKRLVLRNLRLSDLNDFNSYSKKSNIGPMAGWSPHLSMAESEYILRDMIEKKEVMGIVYKDNNKLIGTLGIHQYDKEENAKEIGFVLDDTYWGMGLMVELCSSVIDVLFKEDGLKKIFCGHFSHNFQSRRVIEKLGFKLFKIESDARFELYTKEVCLYSMTIEDYFGGKDEGI